MRRIRRVASAATITAMLAAVGIVTGPAANAGLPEETGTPAAYTIVRAQLLVSCTLASVDLGSGDVTPLGNGDGDNCRIVDLAVAPDGGVWGVQVDRALLAATLVHFDPTTGARLSAETITGNFDAANLVEGGIAFDAAGTLYVQLVTPEPGCAGDAVCLYTVDPATAVATFVGNPGPDHEETALFTLGASCAGDMVTTEFSEIKPGATAWDDDTDAAASPARQLDFVDAATGLVTDGPPLDPNFWLAGLDYDRVSGTLFALGTFEVLDESADTTTTTAVAPVGVEPEAEPDVSPEVFGAQLYTVDPATGELTEVAPIDETLDVETLAIGGSCAAPEPAPIVLQPTFTG